MRTPISEHHRLSSIDTLRGFALLGILVINIQSFAMISAAYTVPNLHMDITGMNLVIWTLSHVFANLKFMAIFSMLFGAGVILATQLRDQAGQRTWTYHYARTFGLLIFGMIHPYFFWYGTYWSPTRCADLCSVGFAISLPFHSFSSGAFPC
jgi:uncharacterized protein